MEATWSRPARAPENAFTISAGHCAWPATAVTVGSDGGELMVSRDPPGGGPRILVACSNQEVA